MRRLLFCTLSAVVLVVGGCQKNDCCEELKNAQLKNESLVKVDSIKKFDIPEVFTKELFKNNNLLFKEFDKLKLSQVYQVLDAKKDYLQCDDEEYQSYVEKLHNMADKGGEPRFKYLQRQDANNNGTTGFRFATAVPWAIMIKKFDDLRIKCNNGWLHVTYTVNSNPEQKDEVEFSKSSSFENNHSTYYSETLFRGIANKFAKEKSTPLEVLFTKSECPVLDYDEYKDMRRIIFKIKYRTETGDEKHEFYDMSDYPQ